MPPVSTKPTPNPFKTFFHEHHLAALLSIGGLLIIILLIVVIITTSSDNDGIEGTDSRAIEAAAKADYQALSSYPISASLPITSEDPPYTISYELTQDDAGNYNFTIVLNAFSASARSTMLTRLFEENFSNEDPLAYPIKIENFYNPFSALSLEQIKDGSLPTNIEKSSLYKFGDSPYTVQTYTHTLYDGSTNTYRAVLENGELKTLPGLLFTYADLPYLDRSMVKSLNTLE